MTLAFVTLLAFCFTATIINALPPAGGGGGSISGQATSTSCSTTTCASNGSSNSHSLSLTYNTTTGIFSGTLTTNGCCNYQRTYNGVAASYSASGTCITQTFPAPAYTSTPVAAPLLSNIGYTLNGVNVYGPFEAGFSLGSACTVSAGASDAGVDVVAAEQEIYYQCTNAGGTTTQMFMDDCGGHAQPYHIHRDPVCEWNTTALNALSSTGHSSLAALMLDGRGLYGRYETTGTKPTNLDACNGHTGPVPAYTNGSISFPAATNVYHYHSSDAAPFTVGCFGPVASLAACKALYSSSCGSGYSNFTVSGGNYTYDTFCPCFRDASGATYNQFVSSSASSPPPSPPPPDLLMGPPPILLP